MPLRQELKMKSLITTGVVKKCCGIKSDVGKYGFTSKNHFSVSEKHVSDSIEPSPMVGELRTRPDELVEFCPPNWQLVRGVTQPSHEVGWDGLLHP